MTHNLKSAIAVIPARGNSRGIPRKNLQTVAGQPLIVRTIQTAKACPSLARVVVSTDDAEIAMTAELAGAQVVMRPANLATDTASSESAILHALAVLRSTERFEPDLVVFLQCTSPLATVDDVEGTLAVLRERRADSALAVCASHKFLWRLDENGDAAGVNHDRSVRLRRQDREQEYTEAGSVYVFRTDGFLRSKHRFFGRVAMHVVDSARGLEIDHPEDLELADWLANRNGGFDLRFVPAPLAGVVFDFDGVFTDNAVLTGDDGREAVRCSRSDGLGIERLRNASVPMVVISKERNPVVAARCRKLGLECLQGIDDKVTALNSWASSQGCSLSSLVYVGNDVNDVECLRAVGLGVAVADAWPEARRAARVTLRRRGGEGAVRELSDLLLEAIERRS